MVISKIIDFFLLFCYYCNIKELKKQVEIMKKGIHPKYYPKAKIRCACGAIFTIGATKEQMEIEICSQCHPFYTGKEKIVDTMGKVEKFKQRLAKKEKLEKEKKQKK